MKYELYTPSVKISHRKIIIMENNKYENKTKSPIELWNIRLGLYRHIKFHLTMHFRKPIADGLISQHEMLCFVLHSPPWFTVVNMLYYNKYKFLYVYLELYNFCGEYIN